MSQPYEVQVYVPLWGDAVGQRILGEGYWNTVDTYELLTQASEQKVLLSEFYAQVRIVQKAHTVIEETVIG